MIEELESQALMFWPRHLSEMAGELSVIPKLIETQEEFIALLHVANKSPFAWKEVLKATNLPANLFLKHLMVLADIGGEKTQRISRELEALIGSEMSFMWQGKEYKYEFQERKQVWSNPKLKVDGISIVNGSALTPMMEDVINFILFAGSAIVSNLPSEFLNKCVLGNLIGNKEELESFVKQRYIWVSRITGGATANDLGNLAQNYVATYLKQKLKTWDFSLKSIPGISHNERTNISFDIVAHSPKNKYCAIEASFQVTTNSTIERKAGQALARQELLHKNGHKIAYVIDGSGNFTRRSALITIFQYSDCTVTYRDSELDKLVKFLLNFEEEK